jgi:hypothetical protein
VSVAQQLLNIVMGAAGGLVFLYTLYASGQYMVSRGDPGALSHADSTLRDALIGAGFTYGSMLVVKLLASEALRIPALG